MARFDLAQSLCAHPTPGEQYAFQLVLAILVHRQGGTMKQFIATEQNEKYITKRNGNKINTHEE